MIPDIIAFTDLHPFLAGLAIGAFGFGGALGVIGWSLGYEAAMRKVGSWMREPPKLDETHGDLPTLPYEIDADNIDLTWGR